MEPEEHIGQGVLIEAKELIGLRIGRVIEGIDANKDVVLGPCV